jgi:hypothetical protein
MTRRSTTIAVTVTKPSLPSGVEEKIVAALRAGEEPDDSWTHEGVPDDGRLRILPSGRYQSVAGESFSNPNGVSRQQVIAETELGTLVWLVPEPDNPYDPDAVRVFVDKGNGYTGQIGYLPRAHNLGSDIAAGRVVAWLAKKVRRRENAPFGAVLYVVTT